MLRGNQLNLEEILTVESDSVEAVLELCSRHEPMLIEDAGDAGLPDLRLF